MVKLIGPFGSNSCSGAVGPLVFQTGRWGQTVRVNTPQKHKPTEEQKLQNWKFGTTADAWRTESDETKNEYNQRAKGLKMTGFNLYIKENFPYD